jgi:MoaA/NifB/PqqE/SkfB family radical SAM enzyme
MVTIKNNFPTNAYIDICSVCNHKCTFCSNQDERTIKNKMSFQDLKITLDNILNHTELESLGLYSKGEPLINKEIFHMLNYAKSKKITYLFLTTNGSLLNKEIIEELFLNGLDSIKLSINAINKEEYFRIHQKNDFEKVIENLNSIIEYKKNTNTNIKVMISVVSSQLEYEEVEIYYKKLLKENYKYLNLIIVNKIGFTPTNNPLLQSDDSKELDLKMKCPRPFNEINVTSNGQLNLCCMDFFESFNFGSLKEKSLKELWYSNKFVGIRKMHEKGKIPKNHLCYSCLLSRDHYSDKLESIKEKVNGK